MSERVPLIIGPEFNWTNEYHKAGPIFYSEDGNIVFVAEFISEGYGEFKWDKEIKAWCSISKPHLYRIGEGGNSRTIEFAASSFEDDYADEELPNMTEDELEELYAEYSPSNNSRRLPDGRMALGGW